MLCKYYANAMHFNWTKLEKKPRAKCCANAMLTLCNYNPNDMQMLFNAIQILFKCYANAMQENFQRSMEILKWLWKISNDYGKSQMTMKNLKWLWKISNDYEGLKVSEWRYKREKN